MTVKPPATWCRSVPSAAGQAGSWSAGRCLAGEHIEESDLQAECISRHPFRHSGATWKSVGGARLDAFAGTPGHSSVTTTGVYSKIADKIAENLVECLEELMGFS